MSNIGISRHDVEYLFRNARLNMEQIENIGEICKILGKYLFVDRTILEARAEKKIGLSYLEKAVDNHIITEMQDENINDKKDIFYYQLGMGGKYLLDNAGEVYLNLNILAGREVKSRILRLNYFMLDNGYNISLRYASDDRHRFFFCENNIICYFLESISEMDIVRILIRQLSTKDEVITVAQIRERFNFIPVGHERIEIGAKTKATAK